MTVPKDCFKPCVTERTCVVFRVFLLEEGAWIPVSPGFASPQEAAHFAKPMVVQHGHEVLYNIRLVKMWLH